MSAQPGKQVTPLLQPPCRHSAVAAAWHPPHLGRTGGGPQHARPPLARQLPTTAGCQSKMLCWASCSGCWCTCPHANHIKPGGLNAIVGDHHHWWEHGSNQTCCLPRSTLWLPPLLPPHPAPPAAAAPSTASPAQPHPRLLSIKSPHLTLPPLVPPSTLNPHVSHILPFLDICVP